MLKKILKMFSSSAKSEPILMTNEDALAKAIHLHSEYISNTLEPRMHAIIDSMHAEISDIQKNAKKLQQAQLRNTNIPHKEMQIMKGNRESYVKHVELLLEQIEFPKKYSEIEAVHDHFTGVLERFTEQTQKPRAVLHHFFEHEAKAVHKGIGRLHKSYEEMKNLLEADDYNAILRAYTCTKRLDSAKEKHVQLQEELWEKEELLAKRKKEIEKLTSELHSLKNSSAYKTLQELMSEKEHAQKEYTALKSSIGVRFAKIERALRKYERNAIDDREVATEVLRSASDAVTRFPAKKIIDLLKTLKSRVDSGSIELKNNDKIATEIDAMIIESYPEKMAERCNSLQKTIDEAHEKIMQDTVARSITVLEERLQSEKVGVREIEKDVEALHEKRKGISKENIYNDLASALSDALHTSVTLKDSKK
ncbi:MAG: hypothetical protein ACMXYE_00160 [Candidatus Woesearchaeota archaeon]